MTGPYSMFFIFEESPHSVSNNHIASEGVIGFQEIDTSIQITLSHPTELGRRSVADKTEVARRAILNKLRYSI